MSSYGHSDYPAICQASPILPYLRLPNPRTQSTESFPFTTYRLFFQLGTPASHTKPIADILPAV